MVLCDHSYLECSYLPLVTNFELTWRMRLMIWPVIRRLLSTVRCKLAEKSVHASVPSETWLDQNDYNKVNCHENWVVTFVLQVRWRNWCAKYGWRAVSISHWGEGAIGVGELSRRMVAKTTISLIRRLQLPIRATLAVWDEWRHALSTSGTWHYRDTHLADAYFELLDVLASALKRCELVDGDTCGSDTWASDLLI